MKKAILILIFLTITGLSYSEESIKLFDLSGKAYIQIECMDYWELTCWVRQGTWEEYMSKSIAFTGNENKKIPIEETLVKTIDTNKSFTLRYVLISKSVVKGLYIRIEDENFTYRTGSAKGLSDESIILFYNYYKH